MSDWQSIWRNLANRWLFLVYFLQQPSVHASIHWLVASRCKWAFVPTLLRVQHVVQIPKFTYLCRLWCLQLVYKTLLLLVQLGQLFLHYSSFTYVLCFSLSASASFFIWFDRAISLLEFSYFFNYLSISSYIFLTSSALVWFTSSSLCLISCS